MGCSQHYSYLVVEAVLYHRWSAEQSEPLLLTHGADNLTIHHSGRGSIVRICEHNNWNTDWLAEDAVSCEPVSGQNSR